MWLLLLLGLIGPSTALFRNARFQYPPIEAIENAAGYTWTEEYYENMPVDHFSFADTRTYSLRYFLNLTHYAAGGPIFFYTGNEGNLESFAVNTGFMWDNAPEYKAALVFVEHRFYGKSLPFGNDSFSKLENLGLLSSEQALADFAEVITFLKNKVDSSGMLSAWIRIKYPHLVDGAIAASAPVFWFQNAGLPENSYAHIVSRTFKLSGCSLRAIVASFAALPELSKTQEGIDYINDVLRLKGESQVQSADDTDFILNQIYDIMDNVAMVDYPYEANFLKKLPAWPVKAMCQSLHTKGEDLKEQVKALYPILNVWLNGTGDVADFCLRGKKCGDDDQLGAYQGWNWQLREDVFPSTCPYQSDQERDRCKNSYGSLGYKSTLFRPNWVLENYGRDFPTATNIVFSNGFLDPWSAGGWRLEPTTEGSLISLIIEEGAHHYDLRANHPNDTSYVREARRIEKLHISRWIQEAKDKPKQQFKRVQQAVASHDHHSGHRHRHPHHHE
ncbi:putative effector protein [Aphelenchoides fujianensis]|nr:putative effector protein [Aphelenchoides fujianensis]